MNEMRVASIEFAAYLVSSAERRSMTSMRSLGARERRVERAQDVDGALVLGADDHAIRLHEVVDRVALLQELGVRRDGELVRGLLAHDGFDLVAGADRYGRLGDDDRPAGHRRRDGLGGLEDERQIGAAVLAGRRADRQQDHLAAGDALGDVGRERQAPLGGVVRDQLVEARFVDRDLAAIEAVDLGLVEIAADDVVAHVRKAGPRHQPDVPRTNDTDLHGPFT